MVNYPEFNPNDPFTLISSYSQYAGTEKENPGNPYTVQVPDLCVQRCVRGLCIRVRDRNRRISSSARIYVRTYKTYCAINRRNGEAIVRKGVGFGTFFVYI